MPELDDVISRYGNVRIRRLWTEQGETFVAELWVSYAEEWRTLASFTASEARALYGAINRCNLHMEKAYR